VNSLPNRIFETANASGIEAERSSDWSCDSRDSVLSLSVKDYEYFSCCYSAADNNPRHVVKWKSIRQEQTPPAKRQNLHKPGKGCTGKIAYRKSPPIPAINAPEIGERGRPRQRNPQFEQQPNKTSNSGQNGSKPRQRL